MTKPRLLSVPFLFPLFVFTGTVFAGGFPSGSSTLPLLAMRGQNLVCNQGDWVTCPTTTIPAADRTHRYFIEVPTGTTQLTVELFDADVGAGGAAEATAGRDTGVVTVAADALTFTLTTPSGGTPAGIRFVQGNGFSIIGAVTTGLATGAGVAVSCSTAATTTADNAWCQMLAINNPAAGHWELRVANAAATPISYMGVRARDTLGNRDLNVYARSYFHFGNQNVDAGRVYNGTNSFYPYVTEGCQLKAADFDSDDTGDETLRYISRTGLTDVTFTDAANDISGNDAWNDELIGFVSRQSASQYGIWRNEMFSGSGTANHVTPWIGSELAGASPPGAQPLGGIDVNTAADTVVSGESYRWYFPNNAGGAPTKPFFEQRLFSATASPINPTAGVLGTYRVTLSMVNPTVYPITFAGAATNDERVVARIPADIGGGTGANFGFVDLSSTTNCGTITDPANNADNVNIVWEPGIIPALTTCTASYQIRMTPGAAVTAGTVFDMTGTLASNGTRSIFLDETNSRFQFGPICPLSVVIGTSVSVPVVIGWFDARANGERLALRFRTDSEVGTAGFYFYEGADTDERKRLNTKMLSAAGINSLEAKDYAIELDGYRGGPIFVEEINFAGGSTWFGPFNSNSSTGRDITRTPMNWQSTRETLNASRVSTRVLGSSALEILVTKSGPQIIFGQDILASGANFSGVPVRELAIIRNGKSIPISIDGPTLFDLNTRIRFLAETQNDPAYGSTAIYRLERNLAYATRMGKVSTTNFLASGQTSSFGQVVVEPQNFWSFAAPGNDPWYAERIYRAGLTPVEASLDFQLPNRVPNNDEYMRLRLWGGLDLATAPDHQLSVLLNGVEIGQEAFDGNRDRPIDISLANQNLNAGNNRITVRLNPTFDNEGAVLPDVVHLDGLSVSYSKRLSAVDDQLSFGDLVSDASEDRIWSDGVEAVGSACSTNNCPLWQLDGFTTPDLFLYARDQIRSQEVLGLIESFSSVYRVKLPKLSGSQARYFAATLAAHHKPILRTSAAFPVLQNSAQVLAIGPASFATGIAPLLQQRHSEGLTTQFVALESINAKYANHLNDPYALQSFIREAFENAQTRYVILLGVDSYDYENRLGFGAVSIVPTFYLPTHAFVHHGASDLPYSDIDADGDADLALGRMPVRNIDELNAMVAKTLSFEARAPQALALFTADRGDSEISFEQLSEDFAANLSAGFVESHGQHRKIYLDQTTDMQVARQNLQSNVQGDVGLLSFVGHSSPVGWTFSGLLTGADVELWQNSQTPVVITQWGCWGAYFIDPQFQSLPLKLLTSAHGAAALLGVTGLSEVANDQRFAQAFFPLATRKTMRIGDAWQQAQSILMQTNLPLNDVTMGTVLLGDPTLKINP